jgi:putative SOS response-associated peptidase YedK
LIEVPEGALAVAALWDLWQKGEQPLLSCTLLTTAAAPAFAPWHKRMPVLLDASERERWLDNAHTVAANDSLFRSELKQPLRLSPLDRGVGNARNKDPRLLRAVGEPVCLDL